MTAPSCAARSAVTATYAAAGAGDEYRSAIETRDKRQRY